MICLYGHAVLYLMDRHQRDVGQQFRERACGVRIEMVNNDIRYPKCGRKSAKQIKHGLQSTGGGTNPYHLGSSTSRWVGFVEFHLFLLCEDTCDGWVRADIIRASRGVSECSQRDRCREADA